MQEGGMIPDKLWSNCRGEFNKTMMKNLCENLNLEIATGIGYTPISNTMA